MGREEVYRVGERSEILREDVQATISPWSKFELGPDRRIMLTVPFVVGDQFISLASPAVKLKPDRGIVKGF